MNLHNKRIYFLGDSITFGFSASSESKSYVGLFRNQYPDAQIENYGVGGSCISDMCIWDVEDLRTRAKRMKPDADLIIIFGGTNDFHCVTPLGEKTDRKADTFRGAYHLLLDDLITRYANTTIVLCTPLPRFDESMPERDGRVRLAPLQSYVNIVKEMGQYYCLPVIDLFSLDVFRNVQPGEISSLTVDGLHPNDEGHQVLFSSLHQPLLDV